MSKMQHKWKELRLVPPEVKKQLELYDASSSENERVICLNKLKLLTLSIGEAFDLDSVREQTISS